MAWYWSSSPEGAPARTPYRAASAPILAASYSGSLVSVGVLMALMGYVVGTFGGIGVGYLMSIFG